MGQLTGDDHAEAYGFLRDLEAGITREAPSGVAQGSIGYGAGGPMWLDAFRSKRPPTPSELVNAYKAVAYACISLNANAVAKVPLRLYCRTAKGQATVRFWPTRQLESLERSSLMARLHRNRITRSLVGDEGVEEILQHPLLDVLDSPNPYFDGNALIQFLARSLDTIGSVYWYPERPGPEWAPTEIWPLHSQYCFPTKGFDRQIIQNYTYFADQFSADELIRFRNISVRDPYLSGYAPLHACFEQLGLIDYYTAVIESTLKGGARPQGMISPEGGDKMPLSRAERERIELDVNNRFGSGNQGRIWVTDGAVKFTQLTYPPADLAGLEISKDARLLAANCFDVPISMLENESSNKATASEGATQHQRNAVGPRCALIAAAMTHQMARKVDPRLFFAFDEVVEKDRQKDAQVHKIYLDVKVVTPNEVRAQIGLEPREGGDEVNQPPAPVKPGEKAEPDEKGDDK
jgi:HK97 family phage portal protein